MHLWGLFGEKDRSIPRFTGFPLLLTVKLPAQSGSKTADYDDSGVEIEEGMPAGELHPGVFSLEPQLFVFFGVLLRRKVQRLLCS
jgi:hypothetical protein